MWQDLQGHYLGGRSALCRATKQNVGLPGDLLVQNYLLAAHNSLVLDMAFHLKTIFSLSFLSYSDQTFQSSTLISTAGSQGVKLEGRSRFVIRYSNEKITTLSRGESQAVMNAWTCCVDGGECTTSKRVAEGRDVWGRVAEGRRALADRHLFARDANCCVVCRWRPVTAHTQQHDAGCGWTLRWLLAVYERDTAFIAYLCTCPSLSEYSVS